MGKDVHFIQIQEINHLDILLVKFRLKAFKPLFPDNYSSQIKYIVL